MDLNNKPISEYLVNLSNTLDIQEQYILKQVVEILFDDIGLGHSCSNLIEISQSINIHKNIIFGILSKSKLVGIYNSINIVKKNLLAYPFSYIKERDLLFVTKYLQYEIVVAKQINNLKNNNGIRISEVAKKCLQDLRDLQKLHDLPNKDQLDAIRNSLEHKLSIITGGPGTGKTTIIIFLLGLFYKNYGDCLKIKLACPTGKAAKRVQESIANGIKNPLIKIDLSQRIEDFIQNTDSFLTLHRLLGVRRNSIHFRHHEHNLLDIDVLIIDESSMVSLPMFSKLLKSIEYNKIKHIIFLGDKNQLSSVEEGYVFATLVEKEGNVKPETNGYDLFSIIYPKVVSKLNISKRNTNDIGKLATAILANDKYTVQSILHSANVSMHAINFDEIIDIYTNTHQNSYCSYIKMIYSDIDNNSLNSNNSKEVYDKLYQVFTKSTILSVMNVGMYGSNNLNYLVEKKLKELLFIIDEWYVGRPILILQNNYTYSLSNGDIGFCVKRNNDFIILFANGLELIPEALPVYSLAYALTIHKSQGSEYDNINIVINDKLGIKSANNLLNRELIYTAVTRAKNSIAIFGTEDLLLKSMGVTTKRNTGLELLI